MRPPVSLKVVMPVPRRRTAWALGLALGLHLALVAFLRSDAGRAWVRALAPGAVMLPQRGGGGGGGGGRERTLAYISLPAAPAPRPVASPKRSQVVPRPEPAAPVPPPVVPPAADTARVPAPAEAGAGAIAGAGEGAGAGPGAGGGEGGGTGGGVGPGDGPGAGGEGVRETAPEPRQLVLPPADYPKDMRGRRVEVTFYVAADGRVERISVAPEIRDGGFARKFEEAMRNYRFRPARSPEGTPVPGTTTVTVFF
jgi:periplasmic protein TonB